jgi:glycosyltransferase involved in cell wall biosynthesis
VEPLVSIIIPAFNPGRYLEPTIRSALAQTWGQIEVIVVDDGSTDGSLDVAQHYAGPRLRVIAQPNRGSGAARNAGLQASRGDYVQFLDHDDLLDSEKIAIQLKHPEAGRSSRALLMGEITRFLEGPDGGRQNIPADADYHPAFPCTYPEYVQLAAREWLFRWWEQALETTPLAWLIPRALAAAAGPWEERFLSRLDDFEYITRLLLAAETVIPTPGSHAGFRTLVAGSMSSAAQNRSARAFEGQRVALNLCCDHLLAAEDSPHARAACAALLMRFAYSAYPAHAREADAAETRARSFGVPLPPCPGGKIVRTLAPWIGWRPAKRLQFHAIQWGYAKK